MKLATTTSDFYRYTGSSAESLRLIRAAGFKYADMSFCSEYVSRDGIFADGYEKYVENIAKTADEVGIKLVQAHSPMGAPLADDGGRFIADTIRCIDACGAWKIPNIVVHSGYEMGLTKEETLGRNKEFFMPLLEAAEKHGVNILVENFNRMCVPGLYWIDNAPDLLEMIECVNHPLFHAVWDVGHANMQPMPQDEALRLLGGHVRALHIQDNLEDTDSHLLPFLGTLSLDSVMCGLSDIGYDGFFTFEIGDVFVPEKKRRPCGRDCRLASAPQEIRFALEEYLYKMGKCILESYNCYEE